MDENTTIGGQTMINGMRAGELTGIVTGFEAICAADPTLARNSPCQER